MVEKDEGPGEEDGPWAEGWNSRLGMSWKECCRKEYLSTIEWAGKCQELTHEKAALLAALVNMCSEFRGHDLPYGSRAYQTANELINKHRKI